MSDPSEIRLRSIAEVSRALDLPVVEVVRLCQALGVEPAAAWTLTRTEVVRLAEAGSLAEPWEHAPDTPLVERVRHVLRALVDGRWLGPRTLRASATWRGLPRHEQRMLDAAFTVLDEVGWVRTTPKPAGRVIAIAAPVPEPLQAFLDGGPPPEALDEVLDALMEDPR